MSSPWIAPDEPIMEGLAREFLAMCEASMEHLPAGNTRFFSRITLANNTPLENARAAMFQFATSNYLEVVASALQLLKKADLKEPERKNCLKCSSKWMVFRCAKTCWPNSRMWTCFLP